MLTVYFGADLDGYYPLDTSPRCGEVTLGPLGFLGFLETRLALSTAERSHACRVVEYRACLKALNDGARFYSDSFAADPQTTAATLLQWRDTWVAGGWQGGCSPTDVPILRDLAAVEGLTPGRLSLGVGDRLRLVLTALSVNPLGNLKIKLAHNPALLPYLWREILTFLGAEMAEPEFLATAVAEAGTDLHRLQEALRLQQPTLLQGDGTVVLLTAHNETLLGRAVDQIVHNQLNARGNHWFSPLSTTLLHDGQPGVLDSIFVGSDAPKTGLTQTSSWRPPLQILSLSLSLMWAPLDPYRLLEFLSHPVAPLPGWARRKLAEVVAAQPGVGGAVWIGTSDELMAEESRRHPDNPQAGENLRRRIDFWLCPQRHDPVQGAPLTLLSERCGEVGRWAAATAQRVGNSPDERDLLFSACAQAGQAVEILNLLHHEGETHISKLQLERILDQVTAAGSPLSNQEGELGQVSIRTAPGAVIETDARLIWWQFTEPLLPSRQPWSMKERKNLQEAGVYLERIQEMLSFVSRQWLQPVLAAQKQLILAVPRTLGGQATCHHPLFDLIDTLTDGIPCIDVADALSPPTKEHRLPLNLDPVALRPLPCPKRWWQIPAKEWLGPRNKAESYSSLEKFINSPYQWVLNYKAGLYPARIARIDPVTQRGNLLHHLIERLFAGSCDWRNGEQAILESWALETTEDLLQEEGANLLLPGKIKERQELISIARMSVWQLVSALRAARVVAVETEKEVEGSFIGGHLTGYVDLFVMNDAGDAAIIDLKWGGANYRKSLLKDNMALQLALYACLCQNEGRWPAQAFFILQDGRLLAQDQGYFPTADVCAPSDLDPGLGAQSLWCDFEKTWRWRREQLDKGLIEVTISGTSADQGSASPGMAIGEHNDRFNDFDVLTGWTEDL